MAEERDERRLWAISLAASRELFPAGMLKLVFRHTVRVVVARSLVEAESLARDEQANLWPDWAYLRPSVVEVPESWMREVLHVD